MKIQESGKLVMKGLPWSVTPVRDAEPFAVSLSGFVSHYTRGHVACGFPDVDGRDTVVSDRVTELVDKEGVRTAVTAVDAPLRVELAKSVDDVVGYRPPRRLSATGDPPLSVITV